MKNKILFIIWSYTSGGGAEKVLNTLIDALSVYNYDIDVLEYWHSEYSNNNENIHSLKFIVDAKNDNKLVKVIKMFLVYFFPEVLRKKYTYSKYDVEISFNYMIPTFLLKKDNKKIAWIHGDIYELSHKKIKRIIQKKYLDRVDKIVAISENTYNSILYVYPEYKNKTIIINNSYDFKYIINKAKEKKISCDCKKKRLLYLGRFDDNKNPLFLINIIKRLNRNDIKLLCIGEGNLKESLIDKLKNENLEDIVEIKDYQVNPYPYIYNSDILLCCSKSEGFPTVIVEGMILGKPFVSTCVGGTKELSNDDKCGFVANDANEYVKKLECLLDDDDLYKEMSKNCVDFVQIFSKENQGKIVHNLIQDEMER